MLDRTERVEAEAAAAAAAAAARARVVGQVSRSLQLQSLWRTSTAAVS